MPPPDLSALSDEQLLQMLQTASTPTPPPAAPTAPQPSPMQRRMGVGHQGNTAGELATAVEQAPYNFGGWATDKATQMGASPNVAAGVGYGANLAPQIATMFGGGELAQLAKSVPQAMGRKLMDWSLSALPADQKSGKAARAATTMLEQGYSPTKGGVAAMRDKTAGLMDKVDTTIEPSMKELEINALLQRLHPSYEKALEGGDSAKNVAAVGDFARDFLERPGIAGHDTIPIQLAQRIKREMGSEVGSAAYGIGLKPPIELHAKKGLVRGLTEDISAAEPAVAGPNAQASDLLNAIKIAERKAILEGNKNPVPLLPAIAAIAHDPMATMGLWANSSAAVKARLAHMLYSGSRPAGQVGGAYAAKEPLGGQ